MKLPITSDFLWFIDIKITAYFSGSPVSPPHNYVVDHIVFMVWVILLCFFSSMFRLPIDLNENWYYDHDFHDR